MNKIKLLFLRIIYIIISIIIYLWFIGYCIVIPINLVC